MPAPPKAARIEKRDRAKKMTTKTPCLVSSFNFIPNILPLEPFDFFVIDVLYRRTDAEHIRRTDAKVIFLERCHILCVLVLRQFCATLPWVGYPHKFHKIKFVLSDGLAIMNIIKLHSSLLIIHYSIFTMNHDDQSYHDPKMSPEGTMRNSSQNDVVRNPYSKAQKLVTALYMVTDCLEGDEPLKKILRTLGVDFLSKVSLLACPNDYSPSGQVPIRTGVGQTTLHRGEVNLAVPKIIHMISEILSFLDIAVAVGIVSRMNFSILKKEFESLKQHVSDTLNATNILFPEEFFADPETEEQRNTETKEQLSQPKADQPPSETYKLTNLQTSEYVSPSLSLLEKDKGHIQESNVLYKKNVLYKRSPSKQRLSVLNQGVSAGAYSSLERKSKIFKFIKQKKEVTITDISKVVKNCSQKTIQRDVMSLIKEGVLKKIGEKRWSKYVLQSR